MLQVFLLVLLVCSSSTLPVQASPPAEGLYVTVRNDVIANIGELISLKIADLANGDNNFPPYSGQGSGATYTFSNFAFDVSLQGFEFLPSNPPSLNFGWSAFDFIFQFQFHICATSWPHPCDNGYITIYTTNNVQLQVDGSLDLSGANLDYSVSNVALVFNQYDIMIDVDCTSTFCLIPVSDISNAVAQNFVPTFTNGMKTYIQQSASTYLNTIPTTIPIAEAQLDLLLNGGFTFYPPTAAIPNIVFYLDGLFVPDNGQSKRPPFSPSVIPPDSIFLSPKTQVDFVLTPYIIETAIWAADQQGRFNLKITNQDVPADSPIHLDTNDEFFLQAVPGLSKYPNMNITITTALINSATVEITTSGVVVSPQVMATFVLNNRTSVIPAFQLAIDLTVALTMETNQSSNGTIFLYATLASLQNTITVFRTSVGTVNTGIFESVVELLVSFLPTKSVHFGLPISSQYFQALGPQLALNAADFLELGASVKVTYPVPDIQCSSTFACPISTTCCNWSSGWGCCTLPSANCCPGAGCCPSGWQCAGGACQSDRRKQGGSIITIANNTRWVDNQPLKVSPHLLAFKLKRETLKVKIN